MKQKTITLAQRRGLFSQKTVPLAERMGLFREKIIPRVWRNGLFLPEFDPGDRQIVRRSPRFVFGNGGKGGGVAEFAAHGREKDLPRDGSDLADGTVPLSRRQTIALPCRHQAMGTYCRAKRLRNPSATRPCSSDERWPSCLLMSEAEAVINRWS